MASDGFLPASRRSRLSSLTLSIGIVALLLALILTMAPPPDARRRESRLSTFAVAPAAPSPRPAARRSAPAIERPAAAAAAPRPIPVRRPPVPTEPAATLTGVIPMDLASNDVGAIKGTGTRSDGAADGAGDSRAPYGPGGGPGGEALYDAEWYRRPTDAEINGYLPPRPVPPGSWADIACRMVEDYRVENCRALGESPAGSGLARAMRQAAWQFRVRPPRVGGKAKLGTWVRIHIAWDGGGVR